MEWQQSGSTCEGTLGKEDARVASRDEIRNSVSVLHSGTYLEALDEYRTEAFQEQSYERHTSKLTLHNETVRFRKRSEQVQAVEIAAVIGHDDHARRSGRCRTVDCERHTRYAQEHACAAMPDRPDRLPRQRQQSDEERGASEHSEPCPEVHCVEKIECLLQAAARGWTHRSEREAQHLQPRRSSDRVTSRFI